MRLTPRSVLVLACTTALCFLSDASARQIEDWPYDKLFKSAEVVVIVEPLSVRDAEPRDEVTVPPSEEDILIPVVTKFKVIHVVKGELKHPRLDIGHFRFTELGRSVRNAPQLVTFRTKTVAGEQDHRHETAPPEYLLFLKKGKDGRLTFVSGQFDPRFSVKELVEPLPAGRRTR